MACLAQADGSPSEPKCAQSGGRVSGMMYWLGWGRSLIVIHSRRKEKKASCLSLQQMKSTLNAHRGCLLSIFHSIMSKNIIK